MKYINYNFAENSSIYWENQNNEYNISKSEIKETYDVTIVGGGITGLSTAYHLNTDKKILIIDKGNIGYGGSNRNGGFCCLGGTKLSFSEIDSKYGRGDLEKFFDIQKSAINLVENLLNKEVNNKNKGEITYYFNSIQFEKDLRELEKYKKILNINYEKLNISSLKQRRQFISGTIGAIKMNYGYGINPKDLVCDLINKIRKKDNVDFLENTEIDSIEKKDKSFVIELPTGRIKSKKIVIATNGYLNNRKISSRIYKNIIPALSNILVTEPVKENFFNDWKTNILCADNKKLLHYFRLLEDGRILFGGRGGHSYYNTSTYRLILENDFKSMFPEFNGIKFEYFWRGLVGVTYDKIAHIGNNDDKYYAYGYNGNGVSLSTYFGKIMAEIIDEKLTLEKLPKCISDLPKSMNFPALKRFYLFLAYQFYSLKN
jgi:glycine/D-amino acid oxidase-like deaminating enzyme